MRVRIDIGLDLDGDHTFTWEPSTAPGAIDVPQSTLERWENAREEHKVADLRWQHVLEEIEETLYGAERERVKGAERATAVVAVAPVRARRR